MRGEDELAAVLAHEAAHVLARHQAERLSRMNVMGLASVIANWCARLWAWGWDVEPRAVRLRARCAVRGAPGPGADAGRARARAPPRPRRAQVPRHPSAAQPAGARFFPAPLEVRVARGTHSLCTWRARASAALSANE